MWKNLWRGSHYSIKKVNLRLIRFHIPCQNSLFPIQMKTGSVISNWIRFRIVNMSYSELNQRLSSISHSINFWEPVFPLIDDNNMTFTVCCHLVNEFRRILCVINFACFRSTTIPLKSFSIKLDLNKAKWENLQSTQKTFIIKNIN